MNRSTDPLSYPGTPRRRVGAEDLDEPLRLAAPWPWLIGLAVALLLMLS